MRISFDLDDTLIMSTNSERQGLFHRLAGLEKLRKGTIPLIKLLQRKNHKVFVYTTSYRKLTYIRWLFAFHGIWLNGVINQAKHDKIFRKSDKMYYTKYPPAFGIDLHIDDSEGVVIEGKKGAFSVLRIDSNEKNWAEKVLGEVNRMDSKH